MSTLAGRLLRRLLTTASAAALLAVVALWARAQWTGDHADHTSVTNGGRPG